MEGQVLKKMQDKKMATSKKKTKENAISQKSDRLLVKRLIFQTLRPSTCSDESLKFRILACALGLLAKLNDGALEGMRNQRRLCTGAILQIAIGIEATSHNMKEIEDRCWNHLQMRAQTVYQKDTLAIFKAVVINAAWGGY